MNEENMADGEEERIFYFDASDFERSQERMVALSCLAKHNQGSN